MCLAALREELAHLTGANMPLEEILQRLEHFDMQLDDTFFIQAYYISVILCQTWNNN